MGRHRARGARGLIKLPEDAEEARIHRPNFDAMAPSDWAGHRAVRIMLEDLQFPQTAGEVRARAGNWRVPARHGHDMVRMSELLDAFEDAESFRSARDAARRIARRHHGF